MFSNKTAVVTGGNRGIGKEISLELAKNNANVVILYGGDSKSAEETLEEVRKFSPSSTAYKCDVSSFETTKDVVGKIIDEFKKVDYLVNNAGITRDKLMMAMKEEDYDFVMDINLKGAFNMIKHLYGHFAKSRSGKIINVSSISGLDGNAGQTNYSASKAGLVGLTKSVAKELSSRNVQCNCIAPGFIDTAMVDKIDDKFKELILEKIPLKRMGNADEVAKLVKFLLSSDSDYITGQVIRIDGGLTI